MAAITALTVQNTQGVGQVMMVPPEVVSAQIAAIFADIRVDAVKVGMLGDARVTVAVSAMLDGRDCPIILDPVMVAKGGDRLLAVEAVSALRETLLPLATVITPNLPEAADLLACPEAASRDEMIRQARALLALGPAAVLLKGGHLPGNSCPDLLMTAEETLWVEAPRHPTRNSHGTGCSLSSALATQMARLGDMGQAVRATKFYLTRALQAGDRLRVGQGHGPIDHFWTLRGAPLR